MRAHRTQPADAIRRGHLAAATIAVVAITIAPVMTADAAVEPPGPATGHAAVVAQGVADLDAGSHHWSVRPVAIEPGASPTPVGVATPSFLLVGEGGALVSDGDVPVASLAAGEAAFVGPDDELTVQGTGSTPI